MHELSNHAIPSSIPPNQSPEMMPEPRPAAAGNNKPALSIEDHHTILPNPNPRGQKRNAPKQSWEYIIKSGIAGGIAGCTAKTVVAPLDRVKILFQASSPQFAKYTGSWDGFLRALRDIYRNDGGKGLFRGHSATLLRIFPYAGVKFLAYEQVRAIIIPTKEQETHLRRFLAGSLAGCCSVFATYPLEVIRVRLAFETISSQRRGFTDICRIIYNERPPPVHLSAASIEGAQPSTAAHTAASTVAATSNAFNRVTPSSGLANFFRGFTPTLWGMLPYAGCSFLTHDAAGDFMRHPKLAPYTIQPLSERSQSSLAPGKPPPLRAWAELFTGALAGFVSQTVSYPLEVIRRRMQVGGVVGDGHRLSMVEVGRNILRDRGWRGFYVGLGIGYIKVIPMTATGFYAYERGKILLGI